MNIIAIEQLVIPEVKILKIKRYMDKRGYFTEVFRQDKLVNNPDLPSLENKQFIQINESISAKGVVRGLHTQCQPNLDKVLRILRGKIIDIAVDIRPTSATFGKAVTKKLSYNPQDDFEEMILVPFGFAHGIIVVEDCHIQYFQTGLWNKEGETTITLSDPAIDWSSDEENTQAAIQVALTNGIISEKDQSGLTLEAFKALPIAEFYR